MKLKIKFNFITVSILLVLFLSIGIVSASDNITDIIDVQDTVGFSQSDVGVDLTGTVNETHVDETVEVKNTSIKSNNPTIYYKEKGELVSYLRDDNNQPIQNKTLSIFLNDKIYTKVTNENGKIILSLNLKPNTYNVNIKFNGDANYSASEYNAIIKVIKAPLEIKTNNFNTYWKSDLFFKTKITNKVTKKPVSGVKVLFKVCYGKKIFKFYSTTNNAGIASLNKNLNVGSYRVYVSLSDNEQKKYFIYKDSKATMNIKPTAEVGCCSFYLQISYSESLTGFRRDSTYSVNINIKPVVWNGRLALKQYKTNGGYSFHSITTADGWMIGTGGADGANVNKAIENLAGQMVKSGVIQTSKLQSIRSYIRSLGFSIGHFAIKAPNGRYALVWTGGVKFGTLKAGEYISVPNSISCFRHGKWTSFNSNPVTAAVKIGASDSYGVNRRDITVFHWKATTKEGSTTSLVRAYAANDNGKTVGLSTGYLKDNVYFKDRLFSKNILPIAPNNKYLGYYNFGYINKYKIQTIVDAPQINASLGTSKIFKVTVKNKANNVPLNGVTVKLKVFTGTKYNIYSIKAVNGVISFNTSKLGLGSHKVVIFSGYDTFYISRVSRILIVK